MMRPLQTLSPLLLAVFVTLLAPLEACSSSSDSGGSGGGGGQSAAGSCKAGKDSCSPGTDFCCADYHGKFTPASVQQSCSAANGTYSSAPCDAADREASCTLYAGTAAEKVIRYYMGYDGASSSDPVTNCSALKGTYAAD